MKNVLLLFIFTLSTYAASPENYIKTYKKSTAILLSQEGFFQGSERASFVQDVSKSRFELMKASKKADPEVLKLFKDFLANAKASKAAPQDKALKTKVNKIRNNIDAYFATKFEKQDDFSTEYDAWAASLSALEKTHLDLLASDEDKQKYQKLIGELQLIRQD
jgi:hypothetical protein